MFQANKNQLKPRKFQMIVEAGDEMFTRRGLFILDGRFLGPQLNKQVHVSFCENKNQQELLN